MAVISGTVWFTPDAGDPVEARAGDVLIARGTEPVTVADTPHTPPDVIIRPGMRSITPTGEDRTADLDLGLRRWGNDPDGSTRLLLGCYQLRGELSHRLLAALPPVIHVPANALDSPLVDVLGDEIVKDEPGQGAVLDRLFDVLLVAVLRAWHTRPGSARVGWYAAQRDAVIGPVLTLLHSEPAHPWTVAELADRVALSRAALARRFTDLVGEPPMAYLTGWRLAIAADRLLESDTTIEAVAREVGYSSAFALSTAFKRERGISPTEHRTRSATAGSQTG
ncbi:AraC family transcriptional regulator [Propionibacteriaceae bacterium Y2011]